MVSRPVSLPHVTCVAVDTSRVWKYPAHINELEFRSVLEMLGLAAKGHTHQLRVDSQVVLGILRKGRSSSWSLNKLARRAYIEYGFSGGCIPRINISISICVTLCLISLIKLLILINSEGIPGFQILKYFPFNQINSFGVEGYWPILLPLLPQAQATTGCPWCTLRSALPTHTGDHGGGR